MSKRKSSFGRREDVSPPRSTVTDRCTDAVDLVLPLDFMEIDEHSKLLPLLKTWKRPSAGELLRALDQTPEEIGELVKSLNVLDDSRLSSTLAGLLSRTSALPTTSTGQMTLDSRKRILPSKPALPNGPPIPKLVGPIRPMQPPLPYALPKASKCPACGGRVMRSVNFGGEKNYLECANRKCLVTVGLSAVPPGRIINHNFVVNPFDRCDSPQETYYSTTDKEIPAAEMRLVVSHGHILMAVPGQHTLCSID